MPRLPEMELRNADISREASRDINYLMQMRKEIPGHSTRSNKTQTKNNPSYGSSKIVKNKQFLPIGLTQNLKHTVGTLHFSFFIYQNT